MKHLLLLPLLSIGAFSLNKPVENDVSLKTTHQPLANNQTVKAGYEKMSATLFKNQDFFRAEIPDFPFDIHWDVISATVYFSGANFRTVQKGFLKDGSLKPVKNFMDKCTVGSIIVFDEIKVMGPDKRLRTIQPTSYLLY